MTSLYFVQILPNGRNIEKYFVGTFSLTSFIFQARLKIYKEDNGLLHVSEFLVTPTTKGKDVVNRLQRHVHGGCCYLVEVWQGCGKVYYPLYMIISVVVFFLS